MNDGQWNSLRHRLVHERGVHPSNGSTQGFGRHGCQVCRRDSQAVESYKHMHRRSWVRYGM